MLCYVSGTPPPSLYLGGGDWKASPNFLVGFLNDPGHPTDIKESKNIASLHNQITACDTILEVRHTPPHIHIQPSIQQTPFSSHHSLQPHLERGLLHPPLTAS